MPLVVLMRVLSGKKVEAVKLNAAATDCVVLSNATYKVLLNLDLTVKSQ